MSQPVEIVHVDRARAGKAVETLVQAFRTGRRSVPTIRSQRSNAGWRLP